MKKWILIIGVLTLVIAGALFFGLSKLGPLIKSAVNTYGPGITRTEVRLDDVDVSLFKAQAKIKNFYLGNPKGFSTSEAMKVRSILMDVDEATLTKETIVIDRIEVVSPMLTYEKKAKTDNFQAILNNVRKGNSQSKSGGGAKKKEGGKKIVIKDFKLTNGKVNLAAALLGQNQSFSADLPNIHLTNIGEKNGGVTPEKAVQVILAELQKRISSPDVMNLIDKQLKDLNLDPAELEKITPKEVKEAEKSFEDAEKALKGILGN